MIRTNQGAACTILAALLCVAVCLLLSDWVFVRVSDGFRLGTFPLAYLLLTITLIASTALDSRRNLTLAHLEDISMVGLLRVCVFISASLGLAFFQELTGFIPWAFVLALTTGMAMGQKSPFILLVYSMGSALAFFAVFYALGFSISAGPSF